MRKVTKAQKDKSNEVTKFLEELSVNYSNGILPSDQQIAKLSNLIYEKDKVTVVDKDLVSVMRGFEWGMKAMREIIKQAK